MIRPLTLSLAALLAMHSHAQTADLVLFSDDGTKFTLIVDGDVKNAEPATRVVATGIRTETPVLMVKFEDPAIPAIKKPGYLPLGMEYTMMVTTNKKGERILRPTGEAALGTAAKAEPAKPKPSTFEEDAPGPVTEAPLPVDEVITTTTVIEDTDDMEGENVNINMGVNGVGFNMNVKVDDGMGGTGTSTKTTTTTRTTTTTTRTTSTPAPIIDTKPVAKEPEVYRMPGYTGRTGCNWPMTDSEFGDVKKSIESKSFEDTKMTMAKQIAGGRCFTVDQVKGMIGLFSFEDSKLDFAKFAYERTFDIDNYYKVNDAFTFESSVDDLNSYIQAR